MKVVLDTSVWIEHLRSAQIASVLGSLRGRYTVHMDPFVAAELLAGCRSRRERRLIDSILAVFARAGRTRDPGAADLQHAGRALSLLREKGTRLSNPAGALIDAAIAVGAVRTGALVVSLNERDFAKLGSALPLRWESWATFARRAT